MKLVKAIVSALLVGATVLTMTACTGTRVDEIAPKPYPVTVNNIEITAPPNTVASLSPAITQMLFELGFASKLVGYSDDCTAPEATDSNRIGTGLEPDLEAIGSVAPEFVFTNAPFTAEQLAKLDAVNIRVMLIPTAADIATVKQQYKDLIEIMGGQLNLQAAGSAKLAEIDRQLAFIESAIPSKKSFLYIASLDPVIVTDDTIQGAIAGYIGDNVAAGHTGYDVPIEIIPTLTPDIVIYDDSLSVEDIKANEQFGALDAVVNDRMVAVNGGNMALSSTSLIKALQSLCSGVHSGVSFEAPPASSAPSDTASEAPSK